MHHEVYRVVAALSEKDEAPLIFLGMPIADLPHLIAPVLRIFASANKPGANGGNMSVAAISNSSQLASLQTNYQQLRKEFAQLGQDLSGGNLTQAQTDFVTLSQAASSQFGSNSPIAKALNSIGQALQSGDLSSAQQAFSSLPVGLVPANAVSSHSGGHHGHARLQQSLEQLGQALKSGNLTAAQQVFATLQQTWQSAFSSGATTTASTSGGAGTGISTTA